MDKLLQIEKEYKNLRTLRIIFIPTTIVIGILGVIGFCVFGIMGFWKWYRVSLWLLLATLVLIIFTIIISVKYKNKDRQLYQTMERSILNSLGLQTWKYNTYDAFVSVKSKQGVDNYDDVKYFKEHPDGLSWAIEVIEEKKKYAKLLCVFLENNQYQVVAKYPLIEYKIKSNLIYVNAFYINVQYVSPAGRSTASKVITVSPERAKELYVDKSILMSKTEYNKYLKEQKKEELEHKQHEYYEKVNNIVDYANDNRDILRKKSDVDELDKQIYTLFDRTVNSIKKIKTTDSEEWDILDKYISNTDQIVKDIVEKSQRIIAYYESAEFERIKETCNSLMNSQKEFNEYINEKAQSISALFGVRVVRNETVVDDKYNYVRPYKKSITPFTAELSASVFASAENSPLDYIIKNFYPDKNLYPEQIQKLQLLVEELETLKDAKQIIENYKKDYQQYITDVPSYVMDNDEDGFYSKLGFANISEEVLTVEYKFSYTSDGGMAQRSFTVPMTEETIIELINKLQSKLTMSAFVKEQRLLMTSKLRQQIKERDYYTCKYCGNSTYKEPNLLLEIDHIIPVSKGGTTIEENLQTLCWKCNREKSDKVVNEIG